MSKITKDEFDKLLSSCLTDQLNVIAALLPLLQFKKELGKRYLDDNKSDDNLEMFFQNANYANDKIKQVLGL